MRKWYTKLRIGYVLFAGRVTLWYLVLVWFTYLAAWCCSGSLCALNQNCAVIAWKQLYLLC